MARELTVRLAAFCVAFICLVTVSRAAPEAAVTNDTALADTLNGIEHELAAVKTVQASFVQTKDLAVFDQRITMKGRIALENPGRLAWRVDTPVRYVVVLDGSVVRQWDEESGQVQKISLAGNPVFKAVTGQLRAWFSGRYVDLAEEYEIRRDATDGKQIKLVFTPRESSTARQVIRAVTVWFREDKRYIESLLIEDKSGDSTRITFTETVLNKPIDPREWEVKPDR